MRTEVSLVRELNGGRMKHSEVQMIGALLKEGSIHNLKIQKSNVNRNISSIKSDATGQQLEKFKRVTVPEKQLDKS